MGIREDIEKFREQMDALKKAYDQYFLGNTRLPPNKLRDELERFVRTYSLKRSGRSADNFIINSAFATYATHRNQWDKIMKMIEDGTFKRGEDVKSMLKPATSQKSSVITIDTPDNGKIKQLYKMYVEAKKKCGEEISTLSFEKVYSSIKSQIPQIKQKFNCNTVEFKVTIEDGKAKLKAAPK
ncbi:MAG TPA: MXAN_5187 C-terminal domain-containing protein [bacterium]